MTVERVQAFELGLQRNELVELLVMRMLQLSWHGGARQVVSFLIERSRAAHERRLRS